MKNVVNTIIGDNNIIIRNSTVSHIKNVETLSRGWKWVDSTEGSGDSKKPEPFVDSTQFQPCERVSTFLMWDTVLFLIIMLLLPMIVFTIVFIFFSLRGHRLRS